MINVSDNYKEYIKKPSRWFKCRVKCEDVILNEVDVLNISYEENLFNQEEFTLGTAIMTSLNLECTDNQLIEDKLVEGKEIFVEIALYVINAFEYVPLGYFIIKDLEKNNRKITFSTYDRMSKFNEDYQCSLTFPATLLQIADDVCSKVGLTLSTRNFTNFNYQVAIKPDFTNINLRQVLSFISELAGGYARIGRDGKVEIFNINPDVTNSLKHSSFTLNSTMIYDDLLMNGDVITKNNLISLSNKKYSISRIDKLIIDTGSVISEIGTGENAYYITDNIFAQDPPGLAKTIFPVINEISYIPYEIKWQGDPAHQCGDNITISSNGSIINTLVTGRKLNFKGGMTEEYRAVGKSNTAKKSTAKGNVSISIKQVKTEIKVLAGEISQKVSNEEFQTYVRQTAEEISSKVTGDEVETLVIQNAESWKLSINGKLNGMNYNFDGNNFTIGSASGGDKVEHNNLSSKYLHTDGSYTLISANGFERFNGATKKTYKYENEIVFVRIGAGQTIRVQHSDNFNSNSWVAGYSIRGVRPGSDTDHHVLSRMYLSHSNVNGNGFDLTCELYWATSFGQIVTIESGGYIDVSIQFIG